MTLSQSGESSQLSSGPVNYAKEGRPEGYDVAGKIVKVELENFMCHENLVVSFDVHHKNCFYIVGENGTGKSAIFAAMNLGLGGRGKQSGRGDRIQDYIRTGQSQCYIRVTLLNKGEGAYPGYKNFIVVERRITTSVSTYRLTDATDRPKSTRKADLDRILAFFNIELDNRVCWLSQDHARHFLQETKPEALYEMYEEASQLKEVQQLYADLAGRAENRDAKLAEARKSLEEAKEHLKRVRALREEQGQLLRMEEQGQEFEWMLLNASVRDIQKEIHKQEGQLKKVDEAIASFDVKLEQLKAEKTTKADELKECYEQTTDIDNQITALQPTITAVQRELRELKKQIDEANAEKARKEKDKRERKQQMQAAQKTLDEKQRGLGHNFEGELKLLAEEMESLQKKQIELRQRIADVNHVESKEKRATSELQNARAHESALDRQLRGKEEDRRRLADARRNRLAIFGRDVPDIVQLIRSNPNHFEKAPLGPIGTYIKLRADNRWASPVEYFLRRRMNNFICFSANDRKALERLCYENHKSVPQLVVTEFTARRFNVSMNEPPPEYLTMLRAVEVDEPTVYNALVDLLSLENILLIEGEDQARQLMQRPPPKVSQAVTMRCSEVYAAGGGRPYRFYANQPQQPQVFATQFEQIEGELDRDMDGLRAKLREVRDKKRELEAALSAAKEETARVKISMRNDESQLKEIGRKMSELSKRQEELSQVPDEEALINNLKEVLEEDRLMVSKCERTIEACEQTILDMSAKKEETQAKYDKEKNSLGGLRKQKAGIEQQMTTLRTMIEKNRQEAELCQERKERGTRTKAEIGDHIAAHEADLAKERTRLEQETPRFVAMSWYQEAQGKEIPQTKYIAEEKRKNEGKLAAMRLKIEEAKTAFFNDTDEDLETIYKKANASHSHWSQQVKHWKGVCETANQCLDSEKKAHDERRLSLPIMLGDKFHELMGMRDGFKGHLEFNHEEHKISIKITVHGDLQEAGGADVLGSARAKNRRVTCELSQLSGGERSYTTSCYVMALWCVMQAPFRLMDEFDIFMDHQNRRVAMELLTDLAKEHHDKQFIFFTPQRLCGLRNEPNIQVLDLGKRNNTG